METKFIKYKPEQVNLAQIYRISDGGALSEADIVKGTLVVGFTGDGKYTAIGYLRGIARNENTGKLVYEIVNAIEGMEYLDLIENPVAAATASQWLPYMAAIPDSAKRPVVGRVISCNGELAVIYDDLGNVNVNVNSVYELTPCFKETK